MMGVVVLYIYGITMQACFNNFTDFVIISFHHFHSSKTNLRLRRPIKYNGQVLGVVLP